jgi:hypothetical protein
LRTEELKPESPGADANRQQQLQQPRRKVALNSDKGRS